MTVGEEKAGRIARMSAERQTVMAAVLDEVAARRQAAVNFHRDRRD